MTKRSRTRFAERFNQSVTLFETVIADKVLVMVNLYHYLKARDL
ncbi:hypothetical protein [Lelliottia amnigena]